MSSMLLLLPLWEEEDDEGGQGDPIAFYLVMQLINSIEEDIIDLLIVKAVPHLESSPMHVSKLKG